MSFISLEFVMFSSLLISIFFITPNQHRWFLLLIGSCFFYAYVGVGPFLLLCFSTLADYVLAQRIFQAEDQSRRKLYLGVSLLLNLGGLFFFKYASFLGFTDIVSDWDMTSIGLPVGISFYTFTKLGYVIDVYRKKTAAEHHLGYFATFVTFFPNLTSGPIERADHLLPQIKKRIVFDEGRITKGFRRVLWGLFKKIVIADRLAIYVNMVYDQPGDYSGPTILLATIFLSFQIYADFSAYTDIALGIAEIFDIKLFENFRQPYFATSVLDFWRRWHISLTTWIREYLFFPLSRLLLRKSYNRVSPQYIQGFSYLIVMSLVGLWHGANLTFVVWGILHGVYMMAEMLLPAPFRLPPRTLAQTVIRTGITFSLISFAWIFFRADNLSNAKEIITQLFSTSGGLLSGILAPSPADPGLITIFKLIGFADASPRFLRVLQLGLSVLLIAVLLLVDMLDAHQGFLHAIEHRPAFIRWAFYYGTTAYLLLLGAWGTQEFIYFQF